MKPKGKIPLQYIPVWLRVLFVVALVNFAAFILIGMAHGGSAQNGYRKGEHFFVESHGHYTEVSQRFWTYSYYHGLSTLITHLLFFGGLAFFLNDSTSIGKRVRQYLRR